MNHFYPHRSASSRQKTMRIREDSELGATNLNKILDLLLFYSNLVPKGIFAAEHTIQVEKKKVLVQIRTSFTELFSVAPGT
jgi:hypothetical protein